MKRIPRRRIAIAMIGIGSVGIIVSLLGVIVGQRLIQQVETSVDDSLQLTSDALAAVTDSITVIDSIVVTVRSGMTAVQTTMSTVEASLDETSAAIAHSGEFVGGPLPDSLEAVQGVLPTIESIAGSVDRALRVLEQVPFGPSYNPVQPFDEAIANLSSALEPLPGQLRALSGDFEQVNGSTRAVSQQLAGLRRQISELDTRLNQVSTLLDRYAATASQAERLAKSSRTDLADSAGLARLLLVLLGLVFALSQIVPIWLGTVLLTKDTTEMFSD